MPNGSSSFYRIRIRRSSVQSHCNFLGRRAASGQDVIQYKELAAIEEHNHRDALLSYGWARASKKSKLSIPAST
jgi:hypothetical protein